MMHHGELHRVKGFLFVALMGQPIVVIFFRKDYICCHHGIEFITQPGVVAQLKPARKAVLTKIYCSVAVIVTCWQNHKGT